MWISKDRETTHRKKLHEAGLCKKSKGLTFPPMVSQAVELRKEYLFIAFTQKQKIKVPTGC